MVNANEQGGNEMLKRGAEPITKAQAVRFLEDKKHNHINAAGQINRNGDIKNNAVDKAKYENHMQLALIYSDIADMLEKV